MNKRISKDLIISIGILMLCVVTYFSTSIFNLGHKINSIFCFFSFVFIFIATIEKVEKCMFICIPFFISFILVLINNQDAKNTNFIYLLTYASLVELVLYLGNKTDKVKAINWIYKCQKFIYLFGFVCAISTIFFALFPNVYLEIILPLTRGTTYYSSLVYCFNNGYQPGISLHYSTNGIYLTLFIGLCFIEFLYANKNNMYLRLLNLFVAAIALLLTAKRAHIVFSCIAMITLYYVKSVDKRKKSVAKMIIAFFIVLILFIILAQFIPAIYGFVERFFVDTETGSLFDSRNVLYTYALDLFKENPIFGIGWANFKYMAESNINQYNDVHNVYLQILTETGIFGFIIFVLIFIYFIISSINNLKKSMLNKNQYTINERKIFSYNLFLIVFFVCYCWTGNPLYDMTVWMPVVLYQTVSYAIISNNIIKKSRSSEEV